MSIPENYRGFKINWTGWHKPDQPQFVRFHSMASMLAIFQDLEFTFSFGVFREMDMEEAREAAWQALKTTIDGWYSGKILLLDDAHPLKETVH